MNEYLKASECWVQRAGEDGAASMSWSYWVFVNKAISIQNQANSRIYFNGRQHHFALLRASIVVMIV